MIRNCLQLQRAPRTKLSGRIQLSQRSVQDQTLKKDVRVAPYGPDNLEWSESLAVQGRLDQWFTGFMTGDPAQWVAEAFGSGDNTLYTFHHPPPIGSVIGAANLQQFCEDIRALPNVQEWRQDGPYQWVATAPDHSRLDVLVPAVYCSDGPFIKTMQLLFRMVKTTDSKSQTIYVISEASEILTTTQSVFTFPAN